MIKLPLEDGHNGAMKEDAINQHAGEGSAGGQFLQAGQHLAGGLVQRHIRWHILWRGELVQNNLKRKNIVP